jgi:hypothetical protein
LAIAIPKRGPDLLIQLGRRYRLFHDVRSPGT